MLPIEIKRLEREWGQTMPGFLDGRPLDEVDATTIRHYGHALLIWPRGRSKADKIPRIVAAQERVVADKRMYGMLPGDFA